MDSSEETYHSAQPQKPPAGENAPPASQPLSPSLQRAAHVHYVNPNTAPTPFSPPPPVGAGDDAPTLRAQPSPRWPGQACRYCGWRPVEAGSTCPQCHQPVPMAPVRAISWRVVAISALALTTVLALLLVVTLSHHAPDTGLSAAARRTATASATTSVAPTGDIPTASPIVTGTAGKGVGTPRPIVAATPTHTPATPLPTSTPAPTCAWQSRTSTGTVYIYWPGGGGASSGTYGYVLNATIHYDGCGSAYATAAVTSNDTGSPASTVGVVLYRTANCTGSDQIISQQNHTTLVAGAHSIATTSATSSGLHCVSAEAIDQNSANNSQSISSVIVTAD